MVTASAKLAPYQCAKCGAPTSYDPSSGGLVCDHCNAVEVVAFGSGAVASYDLFGKTAIASLQAAQVTGGGREVQCKLCGARSIVTRQADRCAFCDAPEVIEVTEGRAIPPGGVLPFTLDRKQASEKFAGWLRKLWFAPGDLSRRAAGNKLDGVYLPFWTFDASITTEYDGQRGSAHTETEHYTDAQGNDQTRQVQQIDWSPASGTAHTSVTNVITCASPTLPATLVSKLAPWEVEQARCFDGRYLAGFVAERYQIEAADGFTAAYQETIEGRVRGSINASIGGDAQQISSMNVNYDSVSFRQLLLPLWLSAFRYNGKVFHVAVNARSGEVFGERPWSRLKLGLAGLVAAGLLAVVVLVIWHFAAAWWSTRMSNDW